MLVRRRVEYNIGVEFLKDLFKPFNISYRADSHLNVNLTCVFFVQLVCKLKRAVFVNIKNNNCLGLVSRALLAKLGAD